MTTSTGRRRNLRAIPTPHPDTTPRQLIERAAALRPMLRERQEETEANRRISDDTNDRLVEAGFYRCLQPRRFGGYEFDLPTFARMAIEISRGCPSTGWVMTFTAGHTHVFAKFAEEAQVWGYGDNGEFRAPMSSGSATAKPVEGGYMINGYFDYASGCDVATHFFGGANVVSDDGEQKPRLNCLFERSELEIIDNWQIMGMRGSGSKRFQATDVFVPEYRASQRDPLFPIDERLQPGYGVHKGALYAGPSMNILMCEIAAVAVGTAWAALDAYEDLMRVRSARAPVPTARTDTPEFQRRYGEALSLIKTAESALIEYMERCRLDAEEDVRFTPEASQAIVLVDQQVTKLAGEAVDRLFLSAGSSAARPGSALERYFRDMATLRTHITLQFDRNWESVARTHFGIGPAGNMGGFAPSPASVEVPS
jgi:3-hydroxy-9,10-secoandrosta-1,3,5(10)-triene-9,17-dione monooxygenase